MQPRVKPQMEAEEVARDDTGANEAASPARERLGIATPARARNKFDVAREVPAAALEAAQRSRTRELWIAVHLPAVPIEALAADIASSGEERPIAVVEMLGRSQCVVAADKAAQGAGVQPGMSLAAALALMPELQARPRDLRREQALLEKLATRAQQFTSRVSIVPPDGLLLEVKGSLKLFGGAKKLGRAVIAACRDAGACPVLALAPTPLAAMAGARAGQSFIVTDETQLIGQLTSLPLAVLRWPVEMIERLAKIGVRSIGQALRLPRAGFARRFGKEQLASLDQLTGRSADLRREFRSRERFRIRHDLTYDIEHHEGVLEVLQPLLQELERFLRGHQCGITALECRLQHRHASATRCVLKLAAPEVDAERLRALFAERLSMLALPEPVRACELRSGALVSRALCPDSLWQPGEHGGSVGSESPAFIERLRARLGNDAVHGLQLFAEHRPELAWRVAELQSVTEHRNKNRTTPALPPWPAFRRPVWLLSEPQALTEREGAPRYRGPLRLSVEAERIETGWWDGKDAARDYYCATDVRGVRLWIFRERRAPHRWFLHGIFG